MHFFERRQFYSVCVWNELRINCCWCSILLSAYANTLLLRYYRNVAGILREVDLAEASAWKRLPNVKTSTTGCGKKVQGVWMFWRWVDEIRAPVPAERKTRTNLCRTTLALFWWVQFWTVLRPTDCLKYWYWSTCQTTVLLWWRCLTTPGRGLKFHSGEFTIGLTD